MAGFLSITTAEFNFEAFISIVNTIALFSITKGKNTKTIKNKRKEGRSKNKNKKNKGIAPYQKRETNMKVCKLKCHS